jgi:1-acyl-sn-glycerol-3-phosphate acyltransferase
VLPFRSSLVGAARAALAEPTLDHILLQPLAITYPRRQGMPVTRRERPAIAWYGDMDLVPHLRAFLREGALDVLVVWGEPVRFDGASDRKRAAAEAEAIVRKVARRAAGHRENGAALALSAAPDKSRPEPSLSGSEPVKESLPE